MIAFRFKDGVPSVAHEVDVDGEDFAARCGERWPRKADGGVYPSHYAGETCETCKEAA